MTKEDFLNIRFPKKGDLGFQDGEYLVEDYGKEYSGLDKRQIKIYSAFSYNTKWKKLSWTNKSKNIFVKKWLKAKNLDDFLKDILKDIVTFERRFTQLFCEYLGKSEDYFSAVATHYADNCFYTLADAGGVKIGNDNFSFIIPAGGDGSIEVAISQRNIDLPMRYFTSIEGKFDIYSYDCGDDIVASLNGRYGVYAEGGLVFFVKWKD